MQAFVDIETRSATPIKNGTFRYAADTELLLFAWSLNGTIINLWDATAGPMPAELRKLLEDDRYALIAHNAAFERAVLEHVFPGFIKPHRWRCSMARAYAHSLPGSLDTLGVVLGLPVDQRKNTDGHKLIRLFCIPKKDGSYNDRKSHPVEWARFGEYCKQDVAADAVIWSKLPEWNYTGDELALWQLDQTINSRGVCVDLELVNAAIEATDKAKKSLAKRTVEITDGAVESTTQRDELLAHILAAHGVDLPDMQASTLERRLDDPELPDAVKELLRIRLQATTTSTSKYKRILQAVCADGRVRGLLQWCGAGRTGRWAGRIVQPQNFPRASMKQRDIELGIEALKVGIADLVYG